MDQPTAEAIVESLKRLQDQVDTLEAQRAEDASKHLALYAGEHALRETLLQFTQEIAAREGFPVKLFVSRFEEAVAWHRDRFLRVVEGFDPQIAAQIDTRGLTNIPTEAQPPCIFPG